MFKEKLCPGMLRSAVVASGLGLLTAPCAVAQNTAGDSAAVHLQPIYVHFDRRAEEVRYQPRAITVIDGDDLPKGEIETGAAISNRGPGLTFSGFGQPGTDFLKIRGVGALGYPLSATDQLVGFSVDEVPTSMFGFPPTLFDMDQIEIARGPQGTSFGRNALAGGINFVPNRADGKRVRYIDGSLGTDEFKSGDMVMGGWLVPGVLAGRVAVHAMDYEGDIPSSTTGGTLGGASELGGRLSLTAFGDNGWTVSTMAQADYQRRNNSFQILYEDPGFSTSAENRVPENTRENRQVNLRVEKEFDSVTVTSLTGWQRQDLINRPGGYDIELFGAFSGLPPASFLETDPSYFRDIVEDETILSQELRISSAETARFSWVLGVNYLYSDYYGYRDARDAFNTTSNGVTNVDIKTEAWSVFGDATLPVGDRLRLSAGLRYGQEEQRVDGRYASNGFPGTVAAFNQQDEISDDYTTGRLGLSYDIQDELTGYLSYAHGYAAGGYEKLLIGSADGTATDPFGAATNDTFEAGLKFRSNDGRVSANVAAFYNKVKDGQMFDYTFSGPTVFYVFTNQDYNSWGLELDGQAELFSGFKLHGSLSLLDSELVNVSPTTRTGAVEGNEVPLAPNVSANLGVSYRLRAAPLGLPGDFLLGGEWTYVGARQADPGNSWEIPPYDLFNARVTWEKDGLRAYLFANNIADERPIYFASTYTSSAHAVSVGQGRVIGLGFSMIF